MRCRKLPASPPAYQKRHKLPASQMLHMQFRKQKKKFPPVSLSIQINLKVP
jgi:hypothetical protein